MDILGLDDQGHSVLVNDHCTDQVFSRSGCFVPLKSLDELTYLVVLSQSN